MSGETIEVGAECFYELQAECERLKAERAEARRQVSWLEGIRLPHARKQENANGFQRGWHAALSRAAEGSASIADLADLVPQPAVTVEIPVCEAEAENAQLRADLAREREVVAYTHAQNEACMERMQKAEARWERLKAWVLAHEDNTTTAPSWMAIPFLLNYMRSLESDGKEGT